MTGLDLCIAAAQEIGVIGQGQSTLSDSNATIIFNALNRLIDQSCAFPGMIFAAQFNSLELTPSQQTYTIGIDPTGKTTADYEIPRPERITDANLLITAQVRKPLKLYTQAQWAQIRYQQVSGPPRGFYFDRGFVSGLATLYFYLIPDQAYTWEFYSWLANAQLPKFTSPINYPPGYANFWLYWLARAICRPFGKTVTPDLQEDCRLAYEIVAAQNCTVPDLDPEPALISSSGGLYNWMDGQIE